MTNQGRSAALVASATGVALSVLALGLATSAGRDSASLRSAARSAPTDVMAALGLSQKVTMAAAYCFDPLRPPSAETMAALEALMRTDEGLDYQFGSGSWSASLGTPPTTLTWSFVPDGTSTPGISGGNAPSNLFAQMDLKFGNNRALWMSKFQAVFDRWSALTGTNYQRVGNNGNDWDDGAAFPSSAGSNVGGATRGSIRIAGRNIDNASNVLAFNYYPTNGDMVMDTSENWGSAGSDYRFLRNTVGHEHGHGLGLAHVCPINGTKLMEPLLNTAFEGPQHDDVRGIHKLYGDFYEFNNSAAQARNLGTIAFGTTATPSVVPGAAISNSTITSIDRLADQDWFKFTVTASALLNVTCQPRGLTYLDGPQTPSGCSSGTSINSLIDADLVVTVLGTNGTTVLQTASSQPAGGTETISGLLLPAAGTYYVRVTATSSNRPQMYDLRITTQTGSACPLFTDQPQGGTVCPGAGIILYANAIGTPAPTFQWRKDGLNIPGETSTTLILQNLTVNSAGSYTCVATNSCGNSVSNPAVVVVPTLQGFTSHPQSQSVPVGAPVNFSVSVNATGVVLYQWMKNDVNITGATASVYNIAAAAPADAGAYRCMVYNSCDGQLFSNAATLTVGTQPCYANCDNSTSAPVLNVQDFTCFLQRYAAGESYANCDNSTSAPVLNVQDFTCFLQRYAAGCP